MIIFAMWNVCQRKSIYIAFSPKSMSSCSYMHYIIICIILLLQSTCICIHTIQMHAYLYKFNQSLLLLHFWPARPAQLLCIKLLCFHCNFSFLFQGIKSVVVLCYSASAISAATSHTTLPLKQQKPQAYHHCMHLL